MGKMCKMERRRVGRERLAKCWGGGEGEELMKMIEKMREMREKEGEENGDE